MYPVCMNGGEGVSLLQNGRHCSPSSGPDIKCGWNVIGALQMGKIYINKKLRIQHTRTEYLQICDTVRILLN